MNQILIINAGSSNLKAALYEEETRVWASSTDSKGPDDFIHWLHRTTEIERVVAVGHRIVNGGNDFFEPTWVTEDVLTRLEAQQELDPDHAPLELAIVKAIQKDQPAFKQALCFDTAFHHAMPAVASQLSIPRSYGLRRFGFHGLSYTYLMTQVDASRVILCHLGSGASLAAVKDGRCIDTTMGFTPASGIMMSTRSGDLDPGVLLFLARSQGMTTSQLDELVNKQSGLLGVSETTPDMRKLLAVQNADPRAMEAVAMFCYQVKKAIGSYTAVLDGLDELVFSGGIGEHAAEVRARSTQGLEFLGIEIDQKRNSENADVISSGNSRVTVRVIPTNEELVIARAVAKLMES